MFMKLSNWCKHCFGMKTVESRHKQELEDIEQELYTVIKELAYLEHRKNYLCERKSYLL